MGPHDELAGHRIFGQKMCGNGIYFGKNAGIRVILREENPGYRERNSGYKDKQSRENGIQGCPGPLPPKLGLRNGYYHNG